VGFRLRFARSGAAILVCAVLGLVCAVAASAAPPANTAVPTVSGSAVVGSTLTGTTGSWANSPTSYSYQWQRCGYSTAVLADSPVGYWRMDDPIPSTQVADLSGNANTGTYINGPTLGAAGGLAGDSDTAVSFDGSNDYATIPSSTSLNLPSTAITLEAVVKPGTITSQVPIFLKSYSSFNSPYYQYGLFLDATGAVRFSIAVNGSLTGAEFYNTGWVANAWNHIVGTYDGSTARIYVNGTLVGTQMVTVGTINSYATPLDIGAYETKTKSAGNVFPGVIDEVAVYSTALSTARIQAHSDIVKTGCTNISGATSSQYTLTTADQSYKVALKVTATNASGSASAVSSQTGPITVAQPPANQSLPTTSGTFTDTSAVTGTTGSWSGNISGYSYQWKHCASDGSGCSAISGATSSAYSLTSSDVGSTVRLAVTATGPGGAATATSNASSVVAEVAPTNTAAPTVTGTATYNQTLSASTGTWSPTPTSYIYEWQRCDASGSNCAAISGATTANYTLVEPDIGQTIRIHVTASDAAGSTGGSSAVSGQVQTIAPTSMSSPTVSGRLARGQTITANPGTWAPTPASISYQWKRCDADGTNCTDIPGATSAAHKVASADAGRSVSFSAAASNSAGSTSASSASSGVLGAPAAPNIQDGTICGTRWYRDVAGSISSDPGFTGWEFQWKRCNGGWYRTVARCEAMPYYPDNTCGSDSQSYDGIGGALTFAQDAYDRFNGGVAGGTPVHFHPGTGGCSADTRVPEDCIMNLIFTTGLPINLHPTKCGKSRYGVGATTCLTDPVDSQTLQFYSEATDVAYPGTGATFSVNRLYSSGRTTSGILGKGWFLGLESSLTLDTNGDIDFNADDGTVLQYLKQADGSYVAFGGQATLAAVTGGGGYDLTRLDGTHFHFDATGLLTAIVDQNGQGLSIARDGAGLISSVTDAANRTYSFSYTSGLLTRIDLPDGRYVAFAYDTDGLLVSAREPDGGTYSYGYTDGLLTTITDPNGHTSVQNTYTAGGQVTEQQDALGQVTHFSQDVLNGDTQTTTITDARGKTWAETFTDNMLVAQADPLGDVANFAYNEDGQLTSQTDPAGHVTSFAYDEAGNLTQVTDPSPLSYVHTFAYDTSNRLVTATDGSGHTTTYTYDSAGNLISTERPGGRLTTLTRNSSTGQITAITDDRNKTTNLSYDSAGNLTEITSPLGHVTTIGYDAMGRPTTVTSPRGNESGATASDFTWTLTYDDAGRVLALTAPGGQIRHWTYDGVGNPLTAQDGNGNTVTYQYDAANELTHVIDALQDTTSYTYDQVGDLTSRTDGNGHTRTFEYDDADRLTATVLPGGARWSATYDANGNVASATTAAGNATDTAGDGTIAYGYDALNRLSSIETSDGAPSTTYSYDGAGRRTQMTDATGTSSYTYDTAGLLESVAHAGVTTSYDYVGSLVASISATGFPSVANTYNDDGELASVAAGGDSAAYAYDADGNATQVTLSNGDVETHAFGPADLLSNDSVTADGQTIINDTYSYDLNGQAVAIAGLSGNRSFKYDAAERLTDACNAETCPGGVDSTWHYAYDAVGNRTEVDQSGVSTTYAYNPADELTSITSSGNTVNPSYDANGDLTGLGSATYAYDLLGRLAGSTGGDGTATYSYDGDGNRASSTVNGTSTSYVWDANGHLPSLIGALDGSGAPDQSYVYGNGPVFGTYGGATNFFHSDYLGSITAVTDASGDSEWQYAYDPYGGATATAGTASAPQPILGFAGQFRSDNGLNYVRARSYSPDIAEFTTLDPLAPSAMQPASTTYAYAGGSPLVWVDPSGMGKVFPKAPKCSSQGLVGGDLCALDPSAQWVEDHLEFGQHVSDAAQGCASGVSTGFVVGLYFAPFNPVAGPAVGAATGCIVGAVAGFKFGYTDW
jgi:RHS repeat-associated protein